MTDVEVVFRTHSEIEASGGAGAAREPGPARVIRCPGRRRASFAFSFTPLGEYPHRRAAGRCRRRPAGCCRPTATPAAAASRCRSRAISPPSRTRIGYRFRDRGLLEHALTHKSRTAEDPSGGVADNESLEFLGDAILGFVAADVLYREFPEYTEGPKSKAKAALVSTTALAGMSRALGLGDALLLGRGEEKTGGRTKQALLADVFEAVIAAIYLDGGIEPARAFVERQIRPLLADVRRSPVFGRDHKSALQERLQGQGRSLPTYRIAAETGPDHQKVFRVEVRIDGQVAATGTGRTKKDAEQEAARLALAALERAWRLRVGLVTWRSGD